MKKILMSLLVTGILFSCKESSSNTADAKAPINSLITTWEKTWNDHDSTGVRNLFMEDALVIDDNIIGANANEFSAKWIHPNINVVSNLKSKKLQDWSTNDRAGYTGTYELDVIVKDSIIAKPKGVFTVNWVKTDKGDWKITSAIIHSFDEKK